MARIGWLLTLIAALPVLIAPARGAPRYPAPHLTPPRAARCSLACWLRLRGGAEEDSAGSGSGGSAGAAEVMTQTEAGAVDAADASAVPKESDSTQGEEESSSSEESSVARGARGRTTRGGRGGKSASGTRGGRGGKAAPANSAARGGKRAVAGAQALPRGKKRPAVEEGEASTESSVEDKQTLQVAAKPTKKKPLSQMSLHERKSEILLRQYAQEAITATEGFTYERPERPDLPPPATDKGDPRFKPVQTCSLTKRLSKTETVVLTSPGARVSGLMSRELQKATTDSSHASILSRASLQDSKGRDKPRSVAGLVKGQGLVKGSGKSSPLHPYNPTAGHDEWQGGEGRGHRDFAITAGSAAWKEEAYGAGSGDGVQEESALEEAVVSD